MSEPTFDADGYPTEETLSALRAWAPLDLDGAMQFIRPIFMDHGRWERSGYRYILATGGWSGCESAIRALQENAIFWAINWNLSKCGGYFELSGRQDDVESRPVPPPADPLLREYWLVLQGPDRIGICLIDIRPVAAEIYRPPFEIVHVLEIPTPKEAKP
jgi:hypothetical protein